MFAAVIFILKTNHSSFVCSHHSLSHDCCCACTENQKSTLPVFPFLICSPFLTSDPSTLAFQRNPLFCHIDHNDGQFFRAMEWLMFFFRPPLPSMVFQWFWQSWTITIECFFGGPTIGTNGFSMVFKILRAMVNNGFEVNDGLDDPLSLKSA